MTDHNCVDCGGLGAELINVGNETNICACDVERANTILSGNECKECPARTVAVRIIKNGQVKYKCVPCHGPSASIQGEQCTCSAPYVLRDGVCQLCEMGEVYFEAPEGGKCVSCPSEGSFLTNSGECIKCSGPTAHKVGVLCRCRAPYVLDNSGECKLCPEGSLFSDVGSVGHCVPCDGDGATISQSGKCDCIGENKWLDDHTCHQCPSGTLHYDGKCVPCSGPGAVIEGGKCSCKGTFQKTAELCTACSQEELESESGKCVRCMGTGAHLVGDQCHCPFDTILHNDVCTPCTGPRKGLIYTAIFSQYYNGMDEIRTNFFLQFWTFQTLKHSKMM